MSQGERAVRPTGFQKVKDLVTKPTDLQIVERFQESGLNTVITVPCSITASMDEFWREKAAAGEMKYVLLHNEWAMPAIAAGMWFGSGEVPLMHLQNSGASNTGDGHVSFASVYEIPMLSLVTWRGSNERDDSEPHQAIGRQTRSLVKDIMGPYIHGERSGRGILRSIDRAIDDVLVEGRRSTVLLSPDAFTVTRQLSSYDVAETGEEYDRNIDRFIAEKGWPKSDVRRFERISREDALLQISGQHPDAVLIHANGFNSRAAQSVIPGERNFYNAGYMGSALGIAMGIALSNPDIPVVAVDGDANANMGHFIPVLENQIGKGNLDKLHWYILDNRKSASVGSSDSLPLARYAYEYARVIPTVAEHYTDFTKRHPRVGRGEGFAKYIEDDYSALADMQGPLPYMARRFRNVINAMTEAARHGRA